MYQECTAAAKPQARKERIHIEVVVVACDDGKAVNEQHRYEKTDAPRWRGHGICVEREHPCYKRRRNPQPD